MKTNSQRQKDWYTSWIAEDEIRWLKSLLKEGKTVVFARYKKSFNARMNFGKIDKFEVLEFLKQH